MNEEYFNPYPGLRPFDEDEDYLFFGREKQIDDLLMRLRKQHFLAVVGSSGSGKSSLVRSGLLPSLYSGYMAGAGSSWRIAIMRPGDNPIGNLAAALAQPEVLAAEDDPEDMVRNLTEITLRRSSSGLSDTVGQAGLPEEDNLLLVIDQFEELFRFRHTERTQQAEKSDAKAFVDLILKATQNTDNKIFIVITMRSDFLGDCTEFRGLPEAINDGQYLIPRMTREEIKLAITGPVAVGGAEIAPRLVSKLLNDVGDNPDQLPILQHALMRTFDYWLEHRFEDEPVDIKHYNQIGTMREALSNHAEEAYNELGTPRKKEICELVFKELTDRGSNAQGIRRPTKFAVLVSRSEATPEEVAEIVEVFRKPGRSFLMPPEGSPLDKETVIDISHESLMRIWKRLIRWVAEEGKSAENYLRLAEAAALYQEGKIGLWRDPELQIASEWYERNRPNEIWARRYDPSFERAIAFLQYSKEQQDFEIAQKEKQQRARLKRARAFAIIISSIAIVAILAMIIAMQNRNEAVRSKEEAEINARKARENAREARKQEELADINKFEAQANAEQSRLASMISVVISRIAEKNARQLAQSVMSLKETTQKLEEKKDELTQKRDELIVKQKELEESRDALNEQLHKNLKDFLLSSSRNIARQARQLLRENEPDSAIQLAVYAYALNAKMKGPQQSSEHFNSLLNCFLSQKEAENRYYKHRVLSTDYAIRAMASHDMGDFSLLAYGTEEGKVNLLNLDNDYESTYELPSPPRRISFSPDGVYLAVTTRKHKLYVFSLRRMGKNLRIAGTPDIKGGNILHLHWHNAEQGQVLSLATGHSLHFWQVADDHINELHTKPLEDTDAFYIADNGQWIARSKGTIVEISRLGGNLAQLGTSGYTLQKQMQLRTPIKLLALNPQNEKAFVLAADAGGSLWVVPRSELANPSAQGYDRYRKTQHLSGITSMDIASDGSKLLTTSTDRQLKIWNLNAVDQDRYNMGEANWIWSGQFAQDDNFVLVANQNGEVKRWPVNTEFMKNSFLPLKDGQQISDTDKWLKLLGITEETFKSQTDKSLFEIPDLK